MNREHYDDCGKASLKLWRGREGDLMQRCRTCGCVSVAQAVVEPMLEGATCHDDQAPDVEAAPVERGRYWLACVRCDASIWLSNQRPRIPLCNRCKRRRPNRERPDHNERNAA